MSCKGTCHSFALLVMVETLKNRPVFQPDEN